MARHGRHGPDGERAARSADGRHEVQVAAAAGGSRVPARSPGSARCTANMSKSPGESRPGVQAPAGAARRARLPSSARSRAVQVRPGIQSTTRTPSGGRRDPVDDAGRDAGSGGGPRCRGPRPHGRSASRDAPGFESRAHVSSPVAGGDLVGCGSSGRRAGPRLERPEANTGTARRRAGTRRHPRTRLGDAVRQGRHAPPEAAAGREITRLQGRMLGPARPRPAPVADVTPALQSVVRAARPGPDRRHRRRRRRGERRLPLSQARASVTSWSSSGPS